MFLIDGDYPNGEMANVVVNVCMLKVLGEQWKIGAVPAISLVWGWEDEQRTAGLMLMESER